MYDEDSIHCSQHYPVAPQALWELVVRDRSQWWPQLQFRPESGASLKDQWSSSGVAGRPAWIATGVVLAVDEENHCLHFRWAQPGWGAETRVWMRVLPSDEGPEYSILEVEERDFVPLARGVEQVVRNHRDWETHLADLAKVAQ